MKWEERAAKQDYLSAEDQLYLRKVKRWENAPVDGGVPLPVALLFVVFLFWVQFYKRKYLRQLWRIKNIALSKEEKELLLFYTHNRVQEDEIRASDALTKSLADKDLLYRTKIWETREGYRMQHWAREFFELNKKVLQ